MPSFLCEKEPAPDCLMSNIGYFKQRVNFWMVNIENVAEIVRAVGIGNNNRKKDKGQCKS